MVLRAAGLAACILLGTGCQQEAFFCDTPEDCTSGGGGGTCESTGYCSFPDPGCDTGRRYGELAPSGLAGTCVPPGEGTGGSSGPSSTSNSASSTGTPDPTLEPSTSTSSSSSTTADESSTGSSTSDSGEESSSTGDPRVCCDASCSECGDSCVSEALDSTEKGESLSVAVVGTTLIWTTGFTREVRTIDLTTGDSTLLVTLDHIITNIAADDEHIYYLSFPSGFVGRISLATGAQTIVTDANEGVGEEELEAGYGQIVLDDDDVYFALADWGDQTDGGAFRAPKEPSVEPPEQIGLVRTPMGIGFDDDNIYIADRGEDTVLRFEKAAPGINGTEILSLTRPGHLYVTETDVYATGDGQLMRVSKDGSPPLLLVDTGGEIRGITGDASHVYVTDLQEDSVTRVSLFDDEPAQQIATSPGAWGIATDCNNVYWCENDTRSVLRQPK